MDYVKLLNQNNFFAFLRSIISSDKNPAINSAAQQILFAMQNGNNIDSNPGYIELYKKYKFQLKVVKNNSNNRVALYSYNWIGNEIRYIGAIYSGFNPYTINVYIPPPITHSIDPDSIVYYIVDEDDNYIVTDLEEYLFISDKLNISPPDP